MDILGIGVPELVFILLIALIVLGPKDMQKAGKTIGTWMRKVVLSDEWRGIKNASRHLRTLPNELMREANLEDVGKELGINDKYPSPPKAHKSRATEEEYGAWGGDFESSSAPENKIAPPVEDRADPDQKTDAQPETESINSAPVKADNA